MFQIRKNKSALLKVKSSRAKSFFIVYLLSLILFFLLAILSFLFTVNYKGNILWHSYLPVVTFSFILFIGIYLFINYRIKGEVVVKTRSYILLMVVLLIFQICLGIVTTYNNNYRTYSNDFLISDKSQLFKDGTHQYDKNNKNQIIVFYKYGCIFCEKTIPTLLKNLPANQRKNVIFVDGNTKEGKNIATSLGVQHASTVLIPKGETNNIYALGKLKGNNILVNERNLNIILSRLKELD